jgi:hypothetical protein
VGRGPDQPSGRPLVREAVGCSCRYNAGRLLINFTVEDKLASDLRVMVNVSLAVQVRFGELSGVETLDERALLG